MFDSIISVDNSAHFRERYLDFVLLEAEKQIEQHILRRGDKERSEEDYFDILAFENRYKITHQEADKLWSTITANLIKFGWKTHLTFGIQPTVLFIYRETPPPNCW